MVLDHVTSVLVESIGEVISTLCVSGDEYRVDKLVLVLIGEVT